MLQVVTCSRGSGGEVQGREASRVSRGKLGVQGKLPLPTCKRRGPAAGVPESGVEKEGRGRLKPIGTYPQRPSSSRTPQGLQGWARCRTGILSRAARGQRRSIVSYSYKLASSLLNTGGFCGQ